MTVRAAWDQAQSPFHAGEIAVQTRLGVRERVEALGRRMVRSHMPDQHRAFFAQLPMIFLGAVDADGAPWATVIGGPAGFIASPDARTLRIGARPAGPDPVAAALIPGAPVGLLGIDPASRRRNRMNGRVFAVDNGGVTVAVDQAFGNCPQFITPRALAHVSPTAAGPPTAVTAIRAADRALIAGADTFFVASARAAEGGGADLSHRGGPAGFVQIDGDRLTIPDYRGNNHFNTLGNLVENPRAGLLFSDFESGDILALTGRVEILWDGSAIADMPGAKRAWRVMIEAGQRRPGALPVRASA